MPSTTARPTPYLVLSEVVLLHEGQLVPEPLQFRHLMGKVLLVPFPHGIFQEPGAKAGVCHPFSFTLGWVDWLLLRAW